jgi:hypothetical protein
MSLTRKQWEEMWETVKDLEMFVNAEVPPRPGYQKAARAAIKKIKDQIQSVIGQMEQME